MKIHRQNVYPNLSRQFKNQGELAKVIFRTDRSVRRRLSGRVAFEEFEIQRIEEYTGLSREYLLRRAN